MPSKISLILTIFALAILLTFLSAQEQEINVTGDWEMQWATPQGWSPASVVKFVQEGEKLKVTMPGFRGEEIPGEGTVKGNKIEWTISFKGPRGEHKVTYKGTVEGNTMKGKVPWGPRAKIEWKANRKEAE